MTMITPDFGASATTPESGQVADPITELLRHHVPESSSLRPWRLKSGQ